MEQDWPGVGRQIKARRQQIGLSQPAVADLLKEHGVAVDKSMVSRWEGGEKIAEPAYLFALETILECEPGSISRLVGYVPAGTTPALKPEDALRADADLPADFVADLVELIQVRRRRIKRQGR